MKPSWKIRFDVQLSTQERKAIERLLEGKYVALKDASLYVKVQNK